MGYAGKIELYGTVKAVVSICDSMNYITEPEDLETVFRLVNNYLDPGGIFIFDLNTVYKYRELLGEQTIAENREDASFIWDNFLNPMKWVSSLRRPILSPPGLVSTALPNRASSGPIISTLPLSEAHFLTNSLLSK